MNYKLQLPIRICFLLDYPVIFKVFYADFEHLYVHRKIDRITVILLVTLKYLALQINTYSKSATEPWNNMWNLLKVNRRDCISLLTTCNMSKAFSSVFLVYYEHAFVYYETFIFTISFLMSFLSILNRFYTPWYTFSSIDFKRSVITGVL